MKARDASASKKQTSEDSATQLIDTGGWVLQFTRKIKLIAWSFEGAASIHSLLQIYLVLFKPIQDVQSFIWKYIFTNAFDFECRKTTKNCNDRLIDATHSTKMKSAHRVRFLHRNWVEMHEFRGSQIIFEIAQNCEILFLFLFSSLKISTIFLAKEQMAKKKNLFSPVKFAAVAVVVND